MLLIWNRSPLTKCVYGKESLWACSWILTHSWALPQIQEEVQRWFSFHNIKTFSISGTFFSSKKCLHFCKIPKSKLLNMTHQCTIHWKPVMTQLWVNSNWITEVNFTSSEILDFGSKKGTCKLVLAMLRRRKKNPIITSAIAIGNHYYPIKSLPTITEVLLPLIIFVAMSIIKPHL